jgi:hypothetical protein
LPPGTYSIKTQLSGFKPTLVKDVVLLANRSARVNLVLEPGSLNQTVEVTASAIDFVVADGRRLQRANTSGAAQIALRPVSGTGQQTLVTAGKFQAGFDDLGQLVSLHGYYHMW